MKALRIGQALELELEGSRPTVTVRALVQDYELGECTLSLTDPPPVPEALVVDAKVVLRFCTKLGYHEARSTVLELRPGHPPEVLLAELHSERNAQRRAYFRTSAHLPVQLSVLRSKTVKAGETDGRAVSLDVSGGGIKLETMLAVAPDDRVGIVVRVPSKLQPALPPVLISEADVLRVQEVIRRGDDHYQVAAKFRIGREVDRDPWVKLTMDLECGLDRDSEPEPEPEDEPEGEPE